MSTNDYFPTEIVCDCIRIRTKLFNPIWNIILSLKITNSFFFITFAACIPSSHPNDVSVSHHLISIVWQARVYNRLPFVSIILILILFIFGNWIRMVLIFTLTIYALNKRANLKKKINKKSISSSSFSSIHCNSDKGIMTICHFHILFRN